MLNCPKYLKKNYLYRSSRKRQYEQEREAENLQAEQTTSHPLKTIVVLVWIYI